MQLTMGKLLGFGVRQFIEIKSSTKNATAVFFPFKNLLFNMYLIFQHKYELFEYSLQGYGATISHTICRNKVEKNIICDLVSFLQIKYFITLHTRLIILKKYFVLFETIFITHIILTKLNSVQIFFQTKSNFSIHFFAVEYFQDTRNIFY